MFTVEQIKAAHSKVKSGADFPAYIQELKELGVTYYEAFVADGHTDYYGANGYKITSPAKYDALAVAATLDAAQFKHDLKAHQNGKTDYLTFCRDTAKAGVVKWTVNLDKMTCTYYDRSGGEVLVEVIPH